MCCVAMTENPVPSVSQPAEVQQQPRQALGFEPKMLQMQSLLQYCSGCNRTLSLEEFYLTFIEMTLVLLGPSLQHSNAACLRDAGRHAQGLGGHSVHGSTTVRCAMLAHSSPCAAVA